MSNNEKIETVAINFNKLAEYNLAPGKLDEAYAACLKALNSQPEFAPACKTLGNVFQAKGDIEAAKNYYIKAITIFPDFAEAHANLGSMYPINKWIGKKQFFIIKKLSILNLRKYL